jgi:hypothetical protein
VTQFIIARPVLQRGTIKKRSEAFSKMDVTSVPRWNRLYFHGQLKGATLPFVKVFWYPTAAEAMEHVCGGRF